LDESAINHATALAEALRGEDVPVAVNYSLKRAKDQIQFAEKIGADFIICIGKKEMETNEYTIKQLSSGREKIVSASRIADHMFSAMG